VEEFAAFLVEHADMLMVKPALANGGLDERAVTLETLTSIKRGR
jgi:delta-aminolevulinic acid dehydratase/porphobilinogen synthase